MNTRLHRTRWLSLFAGGALGLALAGLALVVVRTQVQRARYQLAELEVQTREIQSELERLRRERQALASPGRIQRLARLQGMRPATPDAWIRLEGPVAGARDHP